MYRKIQQYYLKRIVNSQKNRKVELKNFLQVKSVQILMEINDSSDWDNLVRIVQDYSSKGIKTSVVSYFPVKQLPEDVLKYGYQVFLASDMNWLKMPKKAAIDLFNEHVSDILIVYNPKHSFFVDYLSANATHPFKIGIQSDYDSGLDWTFSVRTKGILHYFDIVNNYLTQINQDK